MAARSARIRLIGRMIASSALGAATVVAVNALMGRPLLEPFVALAAAACAVGAYMARPQDAGG